MLIGRRRWDLGKVREQGGYEWNESEQSNEHTALFLACNMIDQGGSKGAYRLITVAQHWNKLRKACLTLQR